MPSLLILAAVAATSACAKDHVARIVVDRSTDPYVVVTQTGRRLHIMGVDFIDPSAWRAGDRLSICIDRDDPRWNRVVSRVTNLKRKETLGAVEDPRS
jgi:hypothetical protein